MLKLPKKLNYSVYSILYALMLIKLFKKSGGKIAPTLRWDRVPTQGLPGAGADGMLVKEDSGGNRKGELASVTEATATQTLSRGPR